MMVLVTCLVVVVGICVAVGKALVVDEAKGRLRKGLRGALEDTIATMPDALREEWEEEWLAEFEAAQDTPLSAAYLVWGLRRSAKQLVAEMKDGPIPVGSAAGSNEARWRSILSTRFGELRTRMAAWRLTRRERRELLAHDALRHAVHPGQLGVPRRAFLQMKAFVRFTQADMPDVARTLLRDVWSQSRNLGLAFRSSARGITVLSEGVIVEAGLLKRVVQDAVGELLSSVSRVLARRSVVVLVVIVLGLALALSRV